MKNIGDSFVNEEIVTETSTTRGCCDDFEKQRKNFVNSTKFIATLSSSIAHEMRSSLTVIKLYASLLEKCHYNIYATCKKELSDNQQNIATYLDEIKKIVINTDYLIGNLLQQIRCATNTAVGEQVIADKKNLTCCSIVAAVQEVLANYPLLEKEKNLIEFKKNSDFIYIGNSVLTTHVLFNLIKNALRAIKNAGKGKITILLEAGNTTNKLILTDTASGIPENFLPKLFELFASTDQVNGTGVGLAFCKVVMQSYGGDITCNSVENEYTEFTLSFPCVPQQEQGEQVHITKIS